MASFIATSRGRGTSRRPRVSKTPVTGDGRRGRRGQRCARAHRGLASGQQTVVEIAVARHHRLDAERFGRARTRLPTFVRDTIGRRGVVDDRRGHRLDVVARDQHAGRACIDQLRIAADARCDDRQAARHRFEDRVGNAFGQRRQDEEVEVGHEARHVVARPAHPDAIGDAAALHAVVEQRAIGAIPRDHEPHARRDGRHLDGESRAGACEGIDQQSLMLDRRESTDRAHHERVGGLEMAADRPVRPMIDSG
jgi:hypothetical protein